MTEEYFAGYNNKMKQLPSEILKKYLILPRQNWHIRNNYAINSACIQIRTRDIS